MVQPGPNAIVDLLGSQSCPPACDGSDSDCIRGWPAFSKPLIHPRRAITSTFTADISQKCSNMLKCRFCSLVGGSSYVPPAAVDLFFTTYHRTFHMIIRNSVEKCLRLRLSSLGFFNTLSALFTSPSASKELKLLSSNCFLV